MPACSVHVGAEWIGSYVQGYVARTIRCALDVRRFTGGKNRVW